MFIMNMLVIGFHFIYNSYFIVIPSGKREPKIFLWFNR